MTDSDLYKLCDIVQPLDGNKPCAIYIRWHVSPIQAKRVLHDFARHELDFDDDDLENLSEPKFERWRKIPGRDYDDEPTMVIQKGTGKGSFPVSVIDLQDWSR